MEHIGDILQRRKTQTGTLRVNTDTWSDAEDLEKTSADSSCLICHGAGFVHPLLPSGKPDYRRTVPCRCARDRVATGRVEERQRSSTEYSWAPQFELQKSMTFDNFELRRVFSLSEEQLEKLKEKRMTLQEYREEIRQNLEAAYRLAYDFAKSPEGWLVFMGETGCGKTHLAAAIVNYHYQNKQPALFVVVPELLDHLRSTFNPETNVSYDYLFERVKTAPLLVLDDFGEQSTTPWAREKLYQVINYRYNARLATVITTRCPMEDIERAISSRLSDQKISTPFNIMASDYRIDSGAGQSNKKTSHRQKKGRWD